MFLLLGTVVAVGVALGLARGGALLHVRTVSGPGWVPAGFLVATAVVGGVALLPERWRDVVGWPVQVMVGLLAATALIATARRSHALRRAALLGLAGGALNAAVMVPNGGMPVSAHAVGDLRAPGMGEHDPLARHVQADRTTLLSFLGDVLPVRFGPERGVLSIGDMVLLAAAALAAHDIVTQHQPKSEPDKP